MAAAAAREQPLAVKRMRWRPRTNLAERAGACGFDFVQVDGQPYWDETICYQFTLEQIEDDLEAATNELAAMCVDTVDAIVSEEATLRRMNIPEHAWDVIATSWRRHDPTLYGRFDLSYDGENAPRLLEYNADTPTSLFEAAVFQWQWLDDERANGALPADADQFNSIHEALIDRWRTIGRAERLHLACLPDSDEDAFTTAYLADCAQQAGLQTQILTMGDIGIRDGTFTDAAEQPIEQLFKLYPWEWMFADAFGRTPALSALHCVEPAWKILLSTKGILPVLWNRNPGHPNLLEAHFDDGGASFGGRDYVRKPLFSREGENIRLVENGRVSMETPGTYGAGSFIRQASYPLPNFDGHYPVVGSWIVGDAAHGIGIREDHSPITSNRSRFVPHWIA